ncbi:hypothetical protein BX666DRAFT_869168 [Dichotomocladium elegans]|nr:hypothetical protein BX666DRAFT_869168 [Dichotomocladium elegans]
MNSQSKIGSSAQTPQRSKSLQIHGSSLSTLPKKTRPGSFQQQSKTYKKKKPVFEESRRPVQRRRRSNSAHPMMMNYAGPVFNNAPAPSTLPLPRVLNTVTSMDDGRPHHIPSKIVTSHSKFETDPIVAEIQSKLYAALKLGTSQ